MKNVKFADWPESDRKGFSALLEQSSILEHGCESLSHLSASYVRSLKDSYGYWLGYVASRDVFALRGSGIEFLSPELFQEYVAQLRSTFASETVWGRIQNLGRLVCLMRPDSDWRFVQKTARQLYRNMRPLRDIRSRCRPSIELYKLGLKLIDNAETLPDPVRRAREFRNGLIISFLAARPLRLRNLVMIAANRQLQLRGERYWVHFDAGETKRGRELDFPWPESLHDALVRYLHVYRPVLVGKYGRCTTDHHLWAVGQQTLYRMITKHTASWFGRSVNPHSFRHSAATSIAIDDPVHVGIVVSILGHSSLRTAEKYYNKATSIEAARRYQNHIAKLRRSRSRW